MVSSPMASFQGYDLANTDSARTDTDDCEAPEDTSMGHFQDPHQTDQFIMIATTTPQTPGGYFLATSSDFVEQNEREKLSEDDPELDDIDSAISFLKRRKNPLVQKMNEWKKDISGRDLSVYRVGLQDMANERSVAVRTLTEEQIRDRQRAIEESREQERAELEAIKLARAVQKTKREKEAKEKAWAESKIAQQIAWKRKMLSADRQRVRLEKLKNEQIKQHDWLKNQIRKMRGVLVTGLESDWTNQHHSFSTPPSTPGSARSSLSTRGSKRISTLDEANKSIRVEWVDEPQPIRVTLHRVRGVKDRAPTGLYLVLVSLCDRLGGKQLVFDGQYVKGFQGDKEAEELIAQGRLPPYVTDPRTFAGVTKHPVSHTSHFANFDLNLNDQDVHLFVPSDSQTHPRMVLLFELFVLRDPTAERPTDRCVGWTAFPLLDSRFHLIHGRFRAPLIRGEVDDHVDKFETLERAARDDLDNWLGNLYFSVRGLSKYLVGERMYEVKLVTAEELVEKSEENNADLSDRPTIAIDSSRGADRSTPPDFSISTPRPNSALLRSSSPPPSFPLSSQTATVTLRDPLEQARLNLISSNGLIRRFVRNSQQNSGSVELQNFSSSSGSQVSSLVPSRSNTPPSSRPGSRQRGGGIRQPMLLSADSPPPLSASSSSRDGGGFSSEGRRTQHFEHLPFSSNSHDPFHDHENESEKNGGPKYVSKSSFQTYRTSVAAPKRSWNEETLAQEKMIYVKRFMLTNLGLADPKTAQFYVMSFVFLLVFWLRIYTHYFGLWLWLHAFKVPILNEEWSYIFVRMDYPYASLSSPFVACTLASGCIFNCLVASILILIAHVWQTVLKSCPIPLSRFIFAYGFSNIFDSCLVLLVDVVRGSGEPFVLYDYFNDKEGSGLMGVFITAFSYFLATTIAVLLLYNYTLRVHLNGRMMDVYHRITAPEKSLFIPHDLEVSLSEVESVCREAKDWRGVDGSTRKVMVSTLNQDKFVIFLERLHDLLTLSWPEEYFSRVRILSSDLNTDITTFARQTIPEFSAAESTQTLTENSLRTTLISYFRSEVGVRSTISRSSGILEKLVAQTEHLVFSSSRPGTGRGENVHHHREFSARGRRGSESNMGGSEAEKPAWWVSEWRQGESNIELTSWRASLPLHSFLIKNAGLLAEALFWDVEGHNNRVHALAQNLFDYGIRFSGQEFGKETAANLNRPPRIVFTLPDVEAAREQPSSKNLFSKMKFLKRKISPRDVGLFDSTVFAHQEGSFQREDRGRSVSLPIFGEQRSKLEATYLSVHTCALDGTRVLHRHFVKGPDGWICEIFGAYQQPNLPMSMISGNSSALFAQTMLMLSDPIRKMQEVEKVFPPDRIEYWVHRGAMAALDESKKNNGRPKTQHVGAAM